MMKIQNPTSLKSRTQWFHDARFGMFVHWGLYSLLGRGEWAMNREQIPRREYQKLADSFRANGYDPNRWAQVAVDAGMKYMVLTTKHHEGFCLWDSQICAFNSVKSAARRDLLAEYVTAARQAGLKVGLYYSLGDWFNPDWKRGWQGDARARERFMEYTHGLVRELMTNYGSIDILWYDLPQCYSADEWLSVVLNAMVRQLQPQILINNRAMTTEDFCTPEQHVAATPGRMWESCMTLNNHWGHCPSDHDFKSPRDVIRTLANVASGGGNLLLNVGPDGEGRFPVESRKILSQVGQWLKVHGASIYGAEPHRMQWNHWGPSTARGNNLYLHLENYFGTTLTVSCLNCGISKATLLTNGRPLKIRRRGQRHILSGLPSCSPDHWMSVIHLELDRHPRQDFSPSIGTADIFPKFP